MLRLRRNKGGERPQCGLVSLISNVFRQLEEFTKVQRRDPDNAVRNLA